jgi:predicted CoA-binding protein
MPNERASLETFDDFLTQKRIAMVGLSRDPANFQRATVSRTVPLRV